MTLTSEANLSSAPKTSAQAKEEPLGKDELKAMRVRRWRRRWSLLRRPRLIGFLLILGIFLWIFHNRVFVLVKSGEVVVIYYSLLGGTSHNQIAREGLHVIAPWDKAYRYQTQTQTLINSMTVLSRNGLAVTLDAQIRFHPHAELVPYLHRRYGQDYVKTVITPQLTEAVQQVIGQYMPDELYSSENGASITHIFENAKRLIGGVFVQVEDIALFNIKLPDKVQEAVQQKAQAEQKALAAAFAVDGERQEAERKLIEAKSLQTYATTVTAIPKSVLVWKGIEATLELAKSPNAKVIVLSPKESLPLLLGNVPDPEVGGK